jgi:hypothetical protein
MYFQVAEFFILLAHAMYEEDYVICEREIVNGPSCWERILKAILTAGLNHIRKAYGLNRRKWYLTLERTKELLKFPS